MIASRWGNLAPERVRAVFSRCLISSPVRYSRGRTAALVGRLGVTVGFSMVGPPPRFSTWGKSPGELPDWKRVGPAKAAEMLGPAITQEADAGLHARGFAPRTRFTRKPLFFIGVV